MDRWLSAGRQRHLRRTGIRERVRVVHYARTPSGIDIALNGYGRAPSRRYPVVLCHGLAANRFTWDLSEEQSLARWLAALGFDVYTLELRGHGRSQKAGQRGMQFGWRLFDYVWEDLPAAFETLRQITGRPKLHYVGHSMGGIVALCWLAQRKLEAKEGATLTTNPLHSLCTLGSAIDYSGTKSIFHEVRRLLPLSRVLPAVPLGAISSFMSPFALATPNPIDATNVHHSNVNRALYRRLTAVGFHAISTPVLRDLSTCFDVGGISDGTRQYASLLPAETPTLSIAGSVDVQCSPTAAARHGHETRAFGRAYGQADEYGHFDLIIGKRAPTEVWPTIADWLIAHDDA